VSTGLFYGHSVRLRRAVTMLCCGEGDAIRGTLQELRALKLQRGCERPPPALRERTAGIPVVPPWLRWSAAHAVFRYRARDEPASLDVLDEFTQVLRARVRPLGVPAACWTAVKPPSMMREPGRLSQSVTRRAATRERIELVRHEASERIVRALLAHGSACFRLRVR